MNQMSYTSADTIPAKLIADTELVKKVRQHIIPPVHVQLIPTNQCNLKCEFCSCKGDDRETQMSWEVIDGLIPRLSRLGTRAVTITGGGEPMLHPAINEMISSFWDKGIKVGLVSNGLLLDHLSPKAAERLSWCRVSHSDDRPFSEKTRNALRILRDQGQHCGYAFSYVVTQEPNIERLSEIIRFANSLNFTHVRIVADILHSKKINMIDVAKALRKSDIDTGRCIFQPRNEPEPGMVCWIAYLKPTIAANGKIYRCCGAQYAIRGKEGAMPDELCMGTIDTLEESLLNYESAKDGLKCARCYYGSYNRVLRALQTPLNDAEFI